jgi:hypothetical protein
MSWAWQPNQEKKCSVDLTINSTYSFYLQIINDNTLLSIIPILGWQNLLEMNLKKFESIVLNFGVLDCDLENNKSARGFETSVTEALQDTCCALMCLHRATILFPSS